MEFQNWAEMVSAGIIATAIGKPIGSFFEWLLKKLIASKSSAFLCRWFHLTFLSNREVVHACVSVFNVHDRNLLLFSWNGFLLTNVNHLVVSNFADDQTNYGNNNPNERVWCYTSGGEIHQSLSVPFVKLSMLDLSRIAAISPMLDLSRIQMFFQHQFYTIWRFFLVAI